MIAGGPVATPEGFSISHSWRRIRKAAAAIHRTAENACIFKKRGISNEHVCVLVARDREKMTFSQTSGMGRLTKEQLDKAIGHKLSNENVLCTDSWRAFKTYADEKGWIFINSSLMVRFAQRVYTISRTLTIITEGLKDGYNVLME